MARQKSIIGIEGPIGNLSFYSSVFGDIVRQKGGASKEKIRKSPVFKNLRLHQAEFKGCSAAGKLLRQGLLRFTRQCPDHTLVWRVNQVMNRIKDLDLVSARGKRHVQQGISGGQGKALLRGFDFNSKEPLRDRIRARTEIIQEALQINNFVPRRDLFAPAGATHVQLRLIRSVIDFNKNTQQLSEAALTLKLDRQKQNLRISPAVVKGTGTRLYILQFQFLQELNGKLYELKEGAGMGVVEVV